MISLQDKIQKFQKLLYNKQLDDFIPIDEQFIGGGITMESLIKENAFVVQEIKKMKNVFVNYCKLNKTVYEKITEHQISLHTETQKMQNLSHTIDIKLNQSIRQVKEMYQQMQYQSQKTKILVEQAVRPIQEAVNRKIDESSFTKQMKKIICELDDGQIDIDGIISEGNGLLSDDGSIRKRKGKSVTQEEYQLQKQKNLKLVMQLAQKIQELETKNQQNDPILYKNTSTINKLSQIVDSNQNQIFKLNRDIKETKSLINLSEQRVLTEITTRTSDNVWERKLNVFEMSHVIPRFQSLSNEINKNQKENNNHFADLDPKFKKMSEDIHFLFQQTKDNKNTMKKHNRNLQSLTKKLNDEVTIIEEKLNAVDNQKQFKIQELHQKIDSEILTTNKQLQSLSNTIQNLSKTIEDKVLTSVKKNIEVKINEIDKNIHTLAIKQRAIQQQLLSQKGQIHSIKEVLSKKANFSDILLHFERKADKEDFKELRDKIQTSPSYLKSTILDSPEKTRRTISANSRKRTSITKNFVPNEDNKSSLESENEMNSRLFIMGLENDLGFNVDRRRMSYTESTRRKKKIKSTAGMLNLFSNS